MDWSLYNLSQKNMDGRVIWELVRPYHVEHLWWQQTQALLRSIITNWAEYGGMPDLVGSESEDSNLPESEPESDDSTDVCSRIEHCS